MINMHMRLIRRCGMTALIFFAAMVSVPGRAQNFPTSAVRIVVSQAPGSSADVIARTVASKLAKQWGQPVVVENRPGANGNLGMDAVVRSAPNGLTLGLATPSVMTVNPLFYKSMPFRPLEDLVAVTQLTSITFGLFTNAQLPARTPAELIAYAKARPDGLNISSAGVGNLGHLAAELFASQAGIRMTHIPNKGDAPGLLDVASGQTDAMFAPLPSALTMLQSRRLNLLGVASKSRSPLFPNVPTLAEVGLRDVVAEGWTGIVAPAATPRTVIVQIQQAVQAALGDAELKDVIRRQGFEIAGSSSEEFELLMRHESTKWRDFVKASGIKLDE